MRLLADENVSRLVVERLRAAGFDVATIAGAHSGSSDADVLATSCREGRILITEDRDFGK
jgi:predicted nuclease of predicted toxin-antitoxin system